MSCDVVVGSVRERGKKSVDCSQVPCHDWILHGSYIFFTIQSSVCTLYRNESASSMQVPCKFRALNLQMSCRFFELADELQTSTEEFVDFVPGASVLQIFRTCRRVAAKSDTRMRRSASSMSRNLQRNGTAYIRSSRLKCRDTYVLSASSNHTQHTQKTKTLSRPTHAPSEDEDDDGHSWQGAS